MQQEKKYLIGGYAPGNYQCHCGTCGGGFIGDKRAWQCEPCALNNKAKFDALSPAEQVELMKRNAEAINTVLMGHGKPPVQHPGSAVWVNASLRLPQHDNPLPLKIDGLYRSGNFYSEHGQSYVFVQGPEEFTLHQSYFEGIFWLDESPSNEGKVWVKADTKPEHNVGVLVFIPGEDNHITSGMWDISNEWVLLDEYRTPDEEVTHWMPLPAFPEGYPHDMLSDEWVSTLKAIAKEELAKRPSKEGKAEHPIQLYQRHQESKEGNKEREEIEFAEWVETEGFWQSKNDKKWRRWTNELVADTTEQLYEQFKNRNNVTD